tara:strand:- start:54 stop:497 length:444 start_codon:yes stop_codon:yes gene_type:complete
MKETLSRGVSIRSKNVGTKYKVPQAFSKTNIAFNSIVNYSFARKSIVNRSLKDSGHRTGDSIDEMSNMNTNSELRTVKLFKTNKGIVRSESRVPINRRNSSVFGDRFLNYVKENFNPNTTPENSTYQKRLNKAYDELGGNNLRRRLK